MGRLASSSPRHRLWGLSLDSSLDMTFATKMSLEHTSRRGHSALEHEHACANAYPTVSPVHSRVVQRKASCMCGGGCPRCSEQRALQPKLRVSTPGDSFEREADRVAEAMINGGSTGVGHAPSPVGVQRKCACGGTCPKCQSKLPIQTKLAVSEPGDLQEQEADQVAETVMGMHDPEIERQPTWTELACSSPRDEVGEIVQSKTKPLDGLMTRWIQRQIGEAEIEDELVKALAATGAIVQRQADQAKEVEKDEEEEKLMLAKAAGGPTRSGATDLAAHIDSLEGSGQPLPSATRNFMEPRFGNDFNHVRVHTDAKADEVARGLNARAFTVGRNVVFAAGQYSPEKPQPARSCSRMNWPTWCSKASVPRRFKEKSLLMANHTLQRRNIMHI